MKRRVIQAVRGLAGMFSCVGHGGRRRAGMAAGVGIMAALGLTSVGLVALEEGCSTTTEAVPYGGECFVASDCAPGLVCITQPNGARACTDDLSGSTGDPPGTGGGTDGGGAADGAAAEDGGEADGGPSPEDAGGTPDSGGMPDAGRPDAGEDAGDAGTDAGDTGDP